MKVYDGRPGAKDRKAPTKYVGGAGHWGKRNQGRKSRKAK